ncbi:MAG: HDOD domain-containing protein [Deltaproteobacteria bacterium]|nr:HDOD domain-containing protein [Deltaproteobacteria bacterium]
MSLIFNVLKSSGDDLAGLFKIAEEFKRVLFKALGVGGEFPVSSTVVHNLRVLLGNKDPNVAEVVKVICADPILAMRLVSLVNFPAYFRGKPVLSVTNAVSQLGFTRIVDVVSEFAAQKDFATVFTGRGECAVLLGRIMAACIISRKLVELLSPRRRLAEETLIACLLSNLPELLLAFYKANIYAAIVIDAQRSEQDFEKSFKKAFKSSLSEFSEEAIAALSLPKDYGAMMRLMVVPPWNKRGLNAEEKEDTRSIVKSVYVGNTIAAAFFTFEGADYVRSKIKEMDMKSDFGEDDIFDMLDSLEIELTKELDLIGLPPFRLPDFNIRIKPQEMTEPVPKETPAPRPVASLNARLNPFLLELKVLTKSRAAEGEPSRLYHAIHATLVALVNALNFDRACLIAYDREMKVLKIVARYGVRSPSVDAYVRRLDAKGREYLPDLKAYYERQAVFTGDPLFGDDWPFACFPVIIGGEVQGLFYADKSAQPNPQPLALDDQLAVTALAEQWQQAGSDFV